VTALRCSCRFAGRRPPVATHERNQCFPPGRTLWAAFCVRRKSACKMCAPIKIRESSRSHIGRAVPVVKAGRLSPIQRGGRLQKKKKKKREVTENRSRVKGIRGVEGRGNHGINLTGKRGWRASPIPAGGGSPWPLLHVADRCRFESYGQPAYRRHNNRPGPRSSGFKGDGKRE